ncbi:MAG: 5'/3'-nucleotidase SurE [Planctomycetota bacterium]
MRILLTNDDGIRAPGIRALHAALTRDNPIGEVFTVAPLTVQSATSHGVTFSEPLMATPCDDPAGFAVDGRPADCVKIALSELWQERFGQGTRPDLVISGMNAGANCGINVIYSGTVAAAIEAAFLGIPSIAVSLHLGRGKTLFDAGAAHARAAIDAVLSGGSIEPHSCVNINVPRCEDPSAKADAPRGEAGPDAGAPHDPYAAMPITVCPMNTHGLIDRFERRQSPAGHPYYWPAGGGLDFHRTEPGTDVDLLFRRHITLTPLSFDLTAHAQIDRWNDRLAKLHASS